MLTKSRNDQILLLRTYPREVKGHIQIAPSIHNLMDRVSLGLVALQGHP